MDRVLVLYTLSLLLANLVVSVRAFGASPGDGEVTSQGRRNLIVGTAVAGGALASGVALKKSIDGPSPYEPLPDSLTGKLMVVTGGTAGLGLESAKRLAGGGASVVLTTRNEQKGENAAKEIQSYLAEKGISNSNVYAVTLDLDDLDSVKSFPNRLVNSPALEGNKKIDVLMNNAGVMAIPELQLTKNGYERTFQSNHLGHFALTAKLFPMLSKSARVINVSSEAYLIASKGLELDNLNGEREYGPWSSYGQSKLANILFTKELQERARRANLELTAVSLHPGAVQTDLARNLIGVEKWDALKENGPSGFDYVLLNALAFFTRSVESGASTQIYLAAEEGADVGGQYWVDIKPKQVKPAAADMDAAKKLWELSEKLTGVDFKL